jgi:hypothetical protein
MKLIKFAKLLVQLNILFWIIYNTYFGWNLYAASEAEANLDKIFMTIMKVAVALYLMPLFSLYESLFQKEEK